ncbi:hypothetical protein [Rhodovulum sulfidophilum]|uniref:hypothetical protein n=1 Tax=Rhodovulum sulfidophilum TaxID=35806 RepID=UPI001921539D|nr:hypothetical protein [Rhodovulum sulfidophilum]MBL3562916.1 hypothetical protein [Rhodovulum sulfidophilum]
MDDDFNPNFENRLYPELFSVHLELHELGRDLSDLPRLLNIQKTLISLLLETEREIRKAKSSSGNTKEWQYIRYNLLCIGDSLAFLYADRFSLKQTYFDIESGNPKQGSGFLIDKSGAELEREILEAVLTEENIPAVLCDITNVLRYGDVAILGTRDPSILEVKSGKGKDRRAKRQERKMSLLSQFFQTDHGPGYPGIPGDRIRVEAISEPSTYAPQLRAAISDADTEGSASFIIDNCLKVLVIFGEDADYARHLNGFLSPGILANSVNQIKSNRIWGCYYPYPLTFSDPAHFEGFVRGEIHIFTFLDMAAFESELSSEAVSLSVEADELSIQCAIRFRGLPDEEDGAFCVIGDHMMARMWTDFISPRWIVNNSSDSFLKAIRNDIHG